MKPSFTRNLPIVILSTLLAIVLWLFVNIKAKADVVLMAPVTFMNLPANLVIVNDTHRQIEIKVRGPHRYVRRLSQDSFALSIDLGDISKGRATFPVNTNLFPIPPGSELVDISPRELIVETDILWRKEDVPIRASVVGTPADGYIVKSTKINPDKVNVKVAKSRYGSIKEVYTERIDISGVETSITREVPLDLEGLKAKTYEDFLCNVEVEIVTDINDRTFQCVPVEVVGAALDCVVIPECVSLTIRGRRRLIAELRAKDLSVSVNMEGRPTGVYGEKPTVFIPRSGIIYSLQPELVEVVLGTPAPEETDIEEPEEGQAQ